MNKSDLPVKYQYLYDSAKIMFTQEGFAIWYDNVLNDKNTPMPDEYIVKKRVVDVRTAVAQARTAVSGYSTTNGARKAVEALADAIENNL